MTWTINLMYLILWTSLSGAIVSVVWFAIGRLLEKAGFLHITYMLLKVWSVTASDYDAWRCVSFY